MTTVLVVGLGAVGARAARQLAESGDVERVFVADADAGRATRVAKVLGEVATVGTWSDAGPLPPGIDVVACAVPAGAELAVARASVDAGVPCVSSVDDHEAIRELLALDGAAQQARTGVIVGCGLAPGLSEVLARHAAGLVDTVDEVHVARVGVAGPASREVVRHALRDHPLEWRAGEWYDAAQRVGHELVWFPEPVGPHECELVAAGIWCLAEAFPDASRLSVRLGDGRVGRRFGVRHRGDDASWGSARAEVWGHCGPRRLSIVYGVVERTAVAAASVLAVAALASVGRVPGHPGIDRPGVHGLATVVEPVAFLAELARRGVKAATFEGVPAH
ncbi:MAG: hypothetical protein U0V73_02265 [Acidimicrobiia bacterium]